MVARHAGIAGHQLVLYTVREHVGNRCARVRVDGPAHFLRIEFLYSRAALTYLFHNVRFEEPPSVGNCRYGVDKLDRRGRNALPEGVGEEIDGAVTLLV